MSIQASNQIQNPIAYPEDAPTAMVRSDSVMISESGDKTKIEQLFITLTKRHPESTDLIKKITDSLERSKPFPAQSEEKTTKVNHFYSVLLSSKSKFEFEASLSWLERVLSLIERGNYETFLENFSNYVEFEATKFILKLDEKSFLELNISLFELTFVLKKWVLELVFHHEEQLCIDGSNLTFESNYNSLTVSFNKHLGKLLTMPKLASFEEPQQRIFIQYAMNGNTYQWLSFD